MHDYQMVMSIHEQKMTRYQAEAARGRARRRARSDHGNVFQRFLSALEQSLASPRKQPETGGVIYVP